MKSIKVGVFAVFDGDVVTASLIVQRKRGDSWVNESAITVLSGQPDSERIMLLEDNQRLVVEGSSNTRTIYDRSQMAAVPVRSASPMAKHTPETTDGDESPVVPADLRAQVGEEFMDLLTQEQRDQAVTVARLKLKELQASPKAESRPVVEPPAKSQPSGWPAPKGIAK